MRFLFIVTFVLCLNVGMSIINTLNVMDVGDHYVPGKEWYGSMNKSYLDSESYVKSQAEESKSSSFGFGDFVKGLAYFVYSVGVGVIYVPSTLWQLGVDHPYDYYFSLPVYFVYVVGLAQFVANRNALSMK
jgi:hypothetical protein